MVKLVGMPFGRVVFCGNLLEYPVGRVLFYIKLVRNFDSRNGKEFLTSC